MLAFYGISYSIDVMQKYNSHVMGITPFMFTTDFLSWSLKIKCSMRGQEVN